MVGGEEIGLGTGEHWESRRDAKGVSGGYTFHWRGSVCGGRGLPRKSEEWSPDPSLCFKTQFLSLCLSLLIYKMRGLDPVTSGISFTELL